MKLLQQGLMQMSTHLQATAQLTSLVQSSFKNVSHIFFCFFFLLFLLLVQLEFVRPELIVSRNQLQLHDATSSTTTQLVRLVASDGRRCNLSNSSVIAAAVQQPGVVFYRRDDGSAPGVVAAGSDVEFFEKAQLHSSSRLGADEYGTSSRNRIRGDRRSNSSSRRRSSSRSRGLVAERETNGVAVQWQRMHGNSHAPAAAAAAATRLHVGGRRSLQASNTLDQFLLLKKPVHARGAASWWLLLHSPIVGVCLCVAAVLMLVIACAHGTESTAAEFLESVPSLPPRFSYATLEKATRNFSRKLGDGAFGSVYEGFLPKGSRVAVKMLEKTSLQGEKQFRAEVASMGAIRHLNLVRLHGFCSEGSHRLLVYEFMANGSLDSWLFNKRKGDKLLEWSQRFNIALGTARALAYLHEECSDHIIHLDVKPENILLDHQFCPKLSDFGLAKLMEREQSRVVTSMRGTPGYLAPEWLLPHAAVTAKTDVYSFGMVLLELISGRENTNFSLGKEQWYFPAWAFKMVGEGRPMELFDKRLPVEELEYFHKEEAVRTVHAALLCIQDNPALRPSMSRVVHMLQGHVEPEPLNSSSNTRSQSIAPAPIQPPRRLLCAFASSRSDMKVEDLPYSYQQPTIGLSNPARMQMKSPRSVREAAVPSPPAPPPRPQLANWWLPAPRESTLSIEAEMLEELQGISLEGSRESLMPSSSSSNLLALQHPRHDNHQQQQQQPNNMNNQVISSSTIKHLRNLIPPGALGGLSSSSSSSADAAAAAAAAVAAAAAAASRGSQKCIPPWPVKGDVILLRGPGGGDYHGVVREVRSDTKQMRLALLHRVSSESRWSVREEETMWRHWNESIKTLDFWVVLRWSTVAGHGYEKVPVEWTVK